jgi:hypothetical protein
MKMKINFIIEGKSSQTRLDVMSVALGCDWQRKEM